MSTVQSFHEEFPLPDKLYRKWKDGIRVFINAKHSKSSQLKYKETPYDVQIEIIQALEKANIIQRTVKSPYVSSFFLVERENKNPRPIVNFKHLTGKIIPPKFHLKSLFQIAAQQEWPPNLFFVKIDLKHAFFNFQMHEKSKHTTVFKFNNQYFQFNRMPFGLNIAPYVQQKAMDSITSYLKQLTPYCYGYMDDILIASQNKSFLKSIVERLLFKLTKAKWKINASKSILQPQESVEFLGAIWNDKGVTRSAKATKAVEEILSFTYNNEYPLKSKLHQRIRGFLTYYTGFAINCHTIINTILQMSLRQRRKMFRYMVGVAQINTIFFKKKRRKKAIIYSDATPDQLGAIIKSKGPEEMYIEMAAPASEVSILYNEAHAATIPFIMHSDILQDKKISAYIDNKAVIRLAKRGRAKWKTFGSNTQDGFNKLFNLIFLFSYINCNFDITFYYIKSDNNPADALSRL
jgi:hypothetical protein